MENKAHFVPLICPHKVQYKSCTVSTRISGQDDQFLNEVLQ